MDAERERKKSRDMSRGDTTDLWRSKEVAFWAKPWRDAQSTQLNKLSWDIQRPRAGVMGWGHVERPCGEVTFRRYASCPEWSAFTNRWSCNSTEVTCNVDSSRVKHRCQLVIRRKANKCYPELLCYLSSYINLLNLLNLQGLRRRFLVLAGPRPLPSDPDL